MKVFLYECRHGDEKIAAPRSREGWDYLISQMERCNGLSLDEAIAEGFSVSGSFEECCLFMDEGGFIDTIEFMENL